MSEKAKALFLRRRLRVRRNLRRAPNNRPRLSVFRSSKHIYAQVIDDDRTDSGGGLDPRRRAEDRPQDGRRHCRGERRRQAGG